MPCCSLSISGETDWKVIAIDVDDPLADKMNGVYHCSTSTARYPQHVHLVICYLSLPHHSHSPVLNHSHPLNSARAWVCESIFQVQHSPAWLLFELTKALFKQTGDPRNSFLWSCYQREPFLLGACYILRSPMKIFVNFLPRGELFSRLSLSRFLPINVRKSLGFRYLLRK